MRQTLLAALLAGLAAATLATPLAAAPGPRLAITSFDELPKPLALPYAEDAPADRQVNAAMARAKRSGKLVLIDLGGNWCLDCRLLAATMAQPALKTWLARHYETVMVDVGRLDKNLQVPARFGINTRLPGVPAMLIVNPRTGKLLNEGRITALSDARSMSPQGLADWLASWTK